MMVVLVNPPSTPVERYGIHFRSGGMTPPLGLASLASVLRESCIPVRIVDGEALGVADTVAEIFKYNPDFIGFTATTMSVSSASNIASIVRRHSLATTAIGGSHFTAVPLETMRRFPVFSVGVVGEAELTLPELINALGSGRNLSNVKGIVYRDNGNLIQTSRREYISDLDSLPMPAWDLLPSLDKSYCPPAHTVKRLPATLMVTSRGCPARCTFCDRSVFGNTIRANSAEYVVEMMKKLYRDYGIREFQFRDDNFLAFRPRLFELCSLLRKEKLNITWSVAGRTDMVNREVLTELAGSGCWQVWYGIESGSQRILDFIDKRTKLDRIREAVTMTKNAGMEIGGFFMLGIPTETVQDIEDTIHFSRELELDEAHFTFLTPLPGCEMYSTAHLFGKFDNDWRKANMWNPVFVPSDLTEEQLVKYWKRATMGFYLRPRIIRNYAKKIRSWRHIKVYLAGLLSLLESVSIKKYRKEGAG